LRSQASWPIEFAARGELFDAVSGAAGDGLDGQ
jgi:hypothetical protein